MSETRIIQCKCNHEYQDRVYGKGMRVHNLGKGKNKEDVFRCTVCSAEKASK